MSYVYHVSSQNGRRKDYLYHSFIYILGIYEPTCPKRGDGLGSSCKTNIYQIHIRYSIFQIWPKYYGLYYDTDTDT